MADAEPLSPRKTAAVLVIVAGCFAVLWPRLLSPAILGRSSHDPLAPNLADRAQGCCDVFFETDVNAIKIMIELCGNILEKKRGSLDPRTVSAFATGKLPPDVIRECRQEVNSTCGVDISTFLQQNVKLGKTYKQILEEVRSYNSSTCLKMHFGVPTWALGTEHVISKTWSEHDTDNIKQERPPHLRSAAPHPAMRERGKAIPEPPRPPLPPGGPTPETIKRLQGRVRPLDVYFDGRIEPPPVPGVRPPMGGAGGMVPPPKSTQVGLVMPIYTLCIVVFFVYTLCKILFKRTDTTTTEGGNYAQVNPDPVFRRRVFEDQRGSRASPDTKLVVSAISGLVAEVQQQMEENYAQSMRPPAAQAQQSENNVPYKNGSLRSAHDASPVRIVAKEYKNSVPYVIPEENNIVQHKAYVPEPRDVFEKELTPREPTPEPNIVKESTPELLADAIKEELRKHNGDVLKGNGDISHGRIEEDEKDLEELSEEEIEYEEEEEESPVVRQVRASVEKDKATVKVLGMETTAHCEGGAAWGDRPLSPPALPRPATPASPPRRPHEAAEVSSIYLEGDIPLQSRLLVADSETHKEDTADEPVVLSGKMTLSLINDDDKGTPDREIDSVTQDDDFTTASAYTQPMQNNQEEEEELSEEEIEEEVEEIAEDRAEGVEGILQKVEILDNIENELEAVEDIAKKEEVEDVRAAIAEVETVNDFVNGMEGSHSVIKEMKEFEKIMKELEGDAVTEMEAAKDNLTNAKGLEDIIKEIEAVENLEKEVDAVEDILKEVRSVEQIIKESESIGDIVNETVSGDDFVKEVEEEIMKNIEAIKETSKEVDMFENIVKDAETVDNIAKHTKGIEEVVQELERSKDINNVEIVEEIGEKLEEIGSVTNGIESLQDIMREEIDKIVTKAVESVEVIASEAKAEEIKDIVNEVEEGNPDKVESVQDILKEKVVEAEEEVEEIEEEEEELEEIEEFEEEEEEMDKDADAPVNTST